MVNAYSPLQREFDGLCTGGMIERRTHNINAYIDCFVQWIVRQLMTAII